MDKFLNCLFELNICIVNHGRGSRVILIAKENGIPGGTVLLGKGTTRSSLLKFLELADLRKEIVLVLSKNGDGKKFLEKVSEKLKFQKSNHGIAFSIPVGKVYGNNYCENMNESDLEYKGADDLMNLYNSIFVIVDKGKANEVVDAAQIAGARGATIISGRGSGIHETSKIFAFDIEPEKEIVLILVDKEIVNQVCESISEKAKLKEPGKGIMFVQDVGEVYGLR